MIIVLQNFYDLMMFWDADFIKGIYNRLPLIMSYLLDIDLAL